jgi:hypothetical protein
MRLININFVVHVKVYESDPARPEMPKSVIEFTDGRHMLTKEDPGEIYRIIVHTANEMRLGRDGND